MKKNKKEIDNLVNYINYYDYVYRDYSMRKPNKIFSKIKKKIDMNYYKAIVVYPAAVKWEPIQRPHHILRILGEMGYLCFFCTEENQNGFVFEEKFENVYMLNKQEELISLIGNKRVIVLITYFLQYFYSKFLPNATIWFDVLDRLDFMSYYNSYSKKIYNEIIDTADIVTYSANNLHNYVSHRKDAILLENAVNIQDFVIKSKIDFNKFKDCKNIISAKKPVIGYYGAVENWFNFNLIKVLDKTNKYSIVIIGHVNEELEDLIDEYDFENVYFLGIKKFSELKYYGRLFNVGIIPFHVSKLTNSVSPVKFFEYMSMHLPVLTTGINEMTKYKSDVIKIVDENNIVEQCDTLIKLNKKVVESECEKIVQDNTWLKRVSIVEKMF